MKALIIFYLVILGIIFLCLVYRLIVHFQLHRIDGKQESSLFQTKLNHFKRKELKKSFIFLFAGTMGMILIVFFTVVQMLELEAQVTGIRSNNHSLQTEVKKIKRKKNRSPLLKTYPSGGLDLQKNLITNNQTIEKKEQTEKSVSELLQPYFEKANVFYSSGSVADSLNVRLTGSIEATSGNLVILGQNISELTKEIEGVEKISELHITIVDLEGNEIYKGTYLRNEKGKFVFKSEMREGKG